MRGVCAVNFAPTHRYGLFGAVFGRLPCIPVAETVTFIGRKMIDQTKDMIEARFQRKHGWFHDVTVKYGDTGEHFN